MIRVAICDDIPEIIDSLHTMLDHYFNKKDIRLDIERFDCGEAFLNSQTNYDIVFMDIYLGKMNGIEIASNYSKLNNSQFVFITTSIDHAIEAFTLNATHYLVKPLTQDAVSVAIERCLSRLQLKLSNFIEVKSFGGVIPVSLKNITYIEVFNTLSIIHTKASDIQTYMSLETLFELLGNNHFIRAQRSYIVNMDFIDAFFYDHVILKNKMKITLSRNTRVALKKQYQEYLFDLARRGQI